MTASPPNAFDLAAEAGTAHSRLLMADVEPANDAAPLQGVMAAHAAMIAKLSQLRPNVIAGNAADDKDFLARRDHLRDVAEVVDAYVLALGMDAKRFASVADSNIDVSEFTDVLTKAIDGNATYCLDRAAEDLRNQRYDGCQPGPFYRRRRA